MVILNANVLLLCEITQFILSGKYRQHISEINENNLGTTTKLVHQMRARA